MLLVINSNNTNTVFGAFDGDAKRAAWRISTDPRRTADEYAVWLTHLMALEGLKFSDIDGVILSNVVPQASFNLVSLCRRYFKGDPVMVGDPSVKLGFEIRLDRPEEAGADRLANAAGARRFYPMPGIVIDLGTATTFDVIDESGNYCGGAISPGINLAFEALYMGAAKLPRIEIRRPQHVIGKTTVNAMQSGIFWGYIGLIEGLVSRIEAEWKHKMTVIGTGGLVPLVAEGTPFIQHIDPDLTLKGLVEIYKLNSP
ncbi:MAG TPA: type III pantothenate kinase [Alphaproteobacteria bacterium]|nr:type III pantothenate kinase [Alphaproteobacteria bacterium]